MSDHCANACGRVVLPATNRFGRFPGPMTALSRGVEPLDGLFSQSNLGIVTG